LTCPLLPLAVEEKRNRHGIADQHGGVNVPPLGLRRELELLLAAHAGSLPQETVVMSKSSSSTITSARCRSTPKGAGATAAS
jgi:hypothetical protein